MFERRVRWAANKCHRRGNLSVTLSGCTLLAAPRRATASTVGRSLPTVGRRLSRSRWGFLGRAHAGLLFWAFRCLRTARSACPSRLALLSRFPWAFGLCSCTFFLGRRWQWHARLSSFGKANRDGLFRILCAVFTLTNVVKFLLHKFTGCGRSTLAFFRVLLCLLCCLSLWHTIFSPCRVAKQDVGRACCHRCHGGL